MQLMSFRPGTSEWGTRLIWAPIQRQTKDSLVSCTMFGTWFSVYIRASELEIVYA